jgi:hypothetical protein
MGDGKTSPFSPDGKSGAEGNKSGGSSAGMKNQRGPDRPQRSGPPDFNPDSVAPAGRVPKFDPPSDRDGLVTQKADEKGGMKHKPFKLGGSKSAPAENASAEESIEGSVGDIPVADEGE